MAKRLIGMCWSFWWAMACLYAQSSMDTTLLNQGTFGISGKVHRGAALAGGGIVMAIHTGSGKTHVGAIHQGIFEVNGLVEGDYLLYAVPDPKQVPQYLPTYYVNKLQADQAFLVAVAGEVQDVDIYLQPYHPVSTGQRSIQGRFSYADANTDDSTDLRHRWFPSIVPTYLPIAIATQPCKNMPVLLFNETEQVVGWTVTDTNGYFSFEYLPEGIYYARGQRYRYRTENQGFVGLEGNTQQVSLRMMSGDAPMGLEPSTVFSDGQALAYPNPFSDHLMLAHPGPFSICDGTGRALYSSGALTSTYVDTRSWPSGVYLVRSHGHTQKLTK